jgi:hypothetical protein
MNQSSLKIAFFFQPGTEMESKKPGKEACATVLAEFVPIQQTVYYHRVNLKLPYPESSNAL